MRNGPIALLTTTPLVTRILVRMDDDVVLKAALLPCYWGPHRRALPTLLEAMALWHQAPVRVVVSARDDRIHSFGKKNIATFSVGQRG